MYQQAQAATDWYGADRVGDDLFANTLIALDANTGKRLWHFQGVRHDIWDRDFPTPPSLVTVRVNGKDIPAVAQPSRARDSSSSLIAPMANPSSRLNTAVVPASDVPGEVL